MNPLRTIRRILRLGHRREEGQAAFEFMLVLPIFIVFLLMAVDFGVLMYQYVSVANAAREGARYGAVNCGGTGCTTAQIADIVVNRSGGIVDNPAEVTVGWVDGPDAVAGYADKGDSVVVKVAHSHTLLFFPHTFNVASCADMRIEQRDGGSPVAGTGC